MRILFSAPPAYGHLYPVLPLALCRRPRRRVRVDGSVPRQARHLGVSAYDAGSRSKRRGMPFSPRRPATRCPRATTDGQTSTSAVPCSSIGLGRRSASDLAALLPQLEVDMLVYEQGELGAAVAGHAAGIPVVCHSISPRMPAAAIALIAGTRLGRLWSEHGVTLRTFGAHICRPHHAAGGRGDPDRSELGTSRLRHPPSCSATRRGLRDRAFDPAVVVCLVRNVIVVIVFASS